MIGKHHGLARLFPSELLLVACCLIYLLIWVRPKLHIVLSSQLIKAHRRKLCWPLIFIVFRLSNSPHHLESKHWWPQADSDTPLSSLLKPSYIQNVPGGGGCGLWAQRSAGVKREHFFYLTSHVKIRFLQRSSTPHKIKRRDTYNGQNPGVLGLKVKLENASQIFSRFCIIFSAQVYYGAGCLNVHLGKAKLCGRRSQD